MKIISVIPARGGSKSIPKKNIKNLCGKPMIAYSIESSLQSSLIDRVFVSTDDEDIANISLQYGSEVISRPCDISGDTASSESALIHVLDTLRNKESYIPDLIVFLQCTSPLTSHEDIDGTIKILIDNEADSAFAAAPFHYFIWSKNLYGEAVSVNHDKNHRLMRQQRQEQFIEAGAVYVMRVQGFMKYKHRFFGKTMLYEIPEERCFEIDEPVDLLIAERLIELTKKENIV